MSVYHGKWTNCSVGDDFKNGIAYHTCNLECNGKVVTSCEATCSEGRGQKGNWKYSTNITKNHCSNVKKDSQDPCKDGCIKCNDLNVSIQGGTKLDCMIWSLVEPDKSTTSGFGFDYIRMLLLIKS